MFSLHPSEGVIPPEDEVVVTAIYAPVSAGTFSRDHYEIVTVGGNKVGKQTCAAAILGEGIIVGRYRSYR